MTSMIVSIAGARVQDNAKYIKSMNDKIERPQSVSSPRRKQSS